MWPTMVAISIPPMAPAIPPIPTTEPTAWDGKMSDVKVKRFAENRSEEHTSELQSQSNLVCRLLLEKKKKKKVHRLPSHHPTDGKKGSAQLLRYRTLHHIPHWAHPVLDSHSLPPCQHSHSNYVPRSP